MPDVVKHDFLPIPNPDTRWDYGYLEKGQCINFNISPSCLKRFRVYLTFLNEMSLPIYGDQIKSTTYCSSSIAQDGAFHIRFVLRGELDERGFPELDYQLQVMKESENELAEVLIET